MFHLVLLFSRCIQLDAQTFHKLTLLQLLILQFRARTEPFFRSPLFTFFKHGQFAAQRSTHAEIQGKISNTYLFNRLIFLEITPVQVRPRVPTSLAKKRRIAGEIFTGRMPFLSPNQQYWRIEGKLCQIYIFVDDN